MKRPIQHIIHADENKIFQSAIPSLWVTRNQESGDYGIDYEVEIFEEDNFQEGISTGNIFKVQLKGTTKIKKSQKKNKIFVVFSMHTDSIKYLLEEIKIPTFLVVCDIKTEICYWTCFQTSKGLKKRLEDALKNHQGELTVYLDVNSDLKQDIKNGKLIKEFAKSQAVIANKIIVHSDIDVFDYAIENINKEDMLKQLSEMVDLTKYKLLLDHLESENVPAAENLINNVLTSPDSSNRVKFSVILCIERLSIKKYINNGNLGSFKDLNAMVDASIEVSKALKEEFKKNNQEYFNLFAKFLENTSELNLLCEKDFDLFLQLQLHQNEDKGFSSVWKDILSVNYISLANRILELIKEAQNKIKVAIEKSNLFLLPFMAEKLIQCLTFFLKRLKEQKENSEVYKILYGNLTNLLNYSIELSIINKDYEQAGNLEYQRVSLNMPVELEDVITIKNEILDNLNKKIHDEESREKAINLLTEQLSSMELSFAEASGKKNSPESQLHFLKDLARGLDYDISNPKLIMDLEAAIKDRNPETVLKTCNYLYVAFDPNILGQKLRLPSLGEKILFCEKFNYSQDENSLEDLYNSFSNSYCKNCQEKKVRPSFWKWSWDWNDKENKRVSTKYYKMMMSNQ